jgi:HEAT repeat protein
MTKKRATLLAIILIGIVAAVLWVTRSPNEPTYQNKSLHAWLRDLQIGDASTSDPDAARLAFREMGTNAIPSLVKIIESGGPPVQRAVLKFNQKQSVVKLPFGQPWNQTMAATWALCAMGTNARPALPALTNLLLHTNELIPSAIVLASIGSDAIPILLATLTNKDWRIRDAVAAGLGYARADADVVVPALIARLQDNQQVQYTAAISLGELHAKPEAVVPALTNAFPSADSLLRRLILGSLGQFGGQATQAMPTIITALKDENEDVRGNAAWAFKQIDPDAATKAGVQ